MQRQRVVPDAVSAELLLSAVALQGTVAVALSQGTVAAASGQWDSALALLVKSMASGLRLQTTTYSLLAMQCEQCGLHHSEVMGSFSVTE